MTQTTFEKLPVTVLSHIASYAPLNDHVALSGVNKRLHRVSQNDMVWKEKFKKHFPSHYQQAQKEYQKDNNPNYWYRTFKKTYANEYSGLKPYVKSLFSAMKEGDITRLMDFKLDDLTSYMDKSGVTILSWADMKNQALLNHIYHTVVLPFYQKVLTLDIHKVDTFKRTVLYWASCLGQTETVNLLLLIKDGVNINAATDTGATALYVAAQSGHFEIVKALLKKGGNSDIVDKRSTTALYMAAQKGHFEVVKALLENRANVDAATDTGATALYVAAQNGYFEIVKALLEYRANPEVVYRAGTTALYVAAKNGHFEIVKALLEYGANVGVVIKTGATPLHEAAYHGHFDVVRILLENGANVHAATCRDSLTPLLMAEHQNHIRIATIIKQQYLLDFLKKIEKHIANKEDHNKSMCFFNNKSFCYDYLAIQQKAAAQALKRVVIDGEDAQCLKEHLSVLNKGELAVIYERFKDSLDVKQAPKI